MTKEDSGKPTAGGGPRPTENDPAGAAKKPAGTSKRVRTEAREARLAEALRANLRRRKSAGKMGDGTN